MAKYSNLRPRSPRLQPAPTAVNLAGGRAYAQAPKLELVSVLLTTFLQDTFYRTELATAARIRALIGAVNDPRFTARAALYARHTYGMRSASHLVAGELARAVKGEAWARHFYRDLVRRPDDVTETLAYYLAVYGRPVPNALKKGLGAALGRFDAHQLAKYRRAEGAFKLVDAVNLLHPPHSPALARLVRGELAPADTWETQLASAGEAGDAAAVAGAKAEAWAGLVRERKLGYLALLRNVRNILAHAPGVIDELVRQLADPAAVRRSLVLPFQFLSAVEALRDGNLAGADRVLAALDQAVDLALANVPAFGGETLVALDSSASMAGRPQAIGSLFAATLVKATGADLMLFSDDARYLTLNRRDSTLTAARHIPFASGGTNFHAIFQRANRAYDRIVILSDMQGWIGGGAPDEALADYKVRHAVTPRIFSFDLQGHGTLQFPQERVTCLAGWSDRAFELMHKLDRDPAALVREVEAVPLAG